MTKLGNMDLPKKSSMEYCEVCKSWVLNLDKHNKKRHPHLKYSKWKQILKKS